MKNSFNGNAGLEYQMEGAVIDSLPEYYYECGLIFDLNEDNIEVPHAFVARVNVTIDMFDTFLKETNFEIFGIRRIESIEEMAEYLNTPNYQHGLPDFFESELTELVNKAAKKFISSADMIPELSDIGNGTKIYCQVTCNCNNIAEYAFDYCKEYQNSIR